MFKIIFVGLICHMTIGTQHLAVLVWHASHEALIEVPRGAEIFVPGAKTFVLDHTDGGGNKFYSLKNHKIRILGTPVGTETKLETAFTTKVPKLKQVTDGGTVAARDVLDENVLTGAIHSIIYLEGGTLDVDKVWKCNASNNTFSGCLAASTVWKTTASGTAVDLVDEDGRRLRILNTSTLTVTNEDRDSAIPGHFDMFIKLLSDATKIYTWTPELTECDANGKPCDSGAHVECSNSQFP